MHLKQFPFIWEEIICMGDNVQLIRSDSNEAKQTGFATNYSNKITLRTPILTRNVWSRSKMPLGAPIPTWVIWSRKEIHYFQLFWSDPEYWPYDPGMYSVPGSLYRDFFKKSDSSGVGRLICWKIQSNPTDESHCLAPGPFSRNRVMKRIHRKPCDMFFA